MKRRKLTLALLLSAGASLLLSSCNSGMNQVPDGAVSTSTTVRSPEGESLSDSLVLVQVYQQTKGEQWWKQEGWLNDPLEYWKGVKVEVINGEKRVVELRLGAFNLQGTIPPVIGQLSELRALDLKWNERLEGSIPEEIFNLSKLEVLNLRMTGITGTLSPKIGQLTELDTLNLRTFTFKQEVYPFVRNDKVMTGQLPKEIGKLTKLRFLDLGRQKFSGQLPEEIGQCVSLEDMDVELCNFSGALPASMRQLKELHTLTLSGNNFSGEFPKWINELTSLRDLGLKHNAFEGSIPESISDLKNLWHITLTDNKMSGTLPRSMAQMKHLRSILIGKNQFEGDFMTALEPLLNGTLYFVDLSDNNFTGQVPDMQKYRTPITLRGNRLNGALPQSHLANPELLRSVFPQQPGYSFDNISNDEAARRIPKVEEKPVMVHFPECPKW